MKVLKLNMKYLTAAIIPLCLLISQSVWAAEPTYEETFNWLNEKIQESEIGCKYKHVYSQDHWVTERGKTTLIDGVSKNHLVLLLESTQKEVNEGTTETNVIRLRYEYILNKVSSIKIDLPSQHGNCFEVKLLFSAEGTVENLEDGYTFNQKFLEFEISDKAIAERIEKAFRHLVKLASSTDDEPF